MFKIVTNPNDRGQAEKLLDQLEETYRNHRQGLFSMALSITGCAQISEDAIHAAFERLCRRGVPPEGDFVSYVFASVRNSSRDFVRSRKRQAELHDSLFQAEAIREESDPPADHLLEVERNRMLRHAVDQLDELEREVVVMKAFAGLTFDAIAEVLGHPAKTVATRYRRALQKLQEKLRGQL